MDRGLRRDTINRMPHQLRERSTLADIDRELTMNEIAILTRAAPARILGLRHKGHLGVGADAYITIYTPDQDRRRMFERPRYVILPRRRSLHPVRMPGALRSVRIVLARFPRDEPRAFFFDGAEVRQPARTDRRGPSGVKYGLHDW